MRTRITDLLGCEYPILQAGMGGPARSELCAAVTMAGGYGCLGTSGEPPELIRREVSAVRERTDQGFGVNLVPFTTSPALLEEQLHACFEARVHSITFFWDVRPELVARAHEAGCLVLYQVGNVPDAIAAERAGVDAVIAQGVEAGGHVHGTTTSLILLPQVAGSVKVPVLGSGGFASGGSLVAALALGAEGIHCGTVFLATEESYAHEFHKRRIVEATSEDTVYSDVFAINWPPQSPVRTLSNSITEEYASNLLGHGPDDFPREIAAHDGNRPVYRFSTESPLRGMEGNLEALALYAGQVCGSINRIRPAGEVVLSIMQEADAALERLRRTF